MTKIQRIYLLGAARSALMFASQFPDKGGTTAHEDLKQSASALEGQLSSYVLEQLEKAEDIKI